MICQQTGGRATRYFGGREIGATLVAVARAGDGTEPDSLADAAALEQPTAKVARIRMLKRSKLRLKGLTWVKLPSWEMRTS